jgi:uncharacterized protein
MTKSIALARHEQVEKLLRVTLSWARKQQHICGVALVGSEARGNARPDSDIDLIFLTDYLGTFRGDRSWLIDIEWHLAGTEMIGHRAAPYGTTWSFHIALAQAPEMEFGFAPRRWAETAPIDPGTRRVITDGCRILCDPEGLLAGLCAAIAAAQTAGSRNGP